MNNSILRPRRKPRQLLPHKAVCLYWELIKWHVEANRRGAQLILEDPGRVGGLYAGLVRWANVVTVQVSDEQRVFVPDVKDGCGHGAQEGGGRP